MYFVLICLFCITAVLSHDLAQIETRGEVTEPGVEIVRELSDGEDILIRSRRSAKTGVCKYKKGNWSECDKKVMLATRHDSLKVTHSSLGCDKSRIITKKCRESARKATCVYERPKNVPWTDCKESGVKHRVFPLMKENGAGGCPNEKVMFKKCKRDNKEDKMSQITELKKAKCQLSAWDDWTPCRDGNQQRIRKVMKGAEKKSCQKKALQNNKC